ncbi:CWF19-like protein 2-like [Papilio machaon]|uniref:CWF19-like protein 2-like n=1 Tax=Papilio machaon TaxID=76193 RepID=A0A194RRM0_PAPMA|nr:CWF19-like protein 2-like [Papilio machaon]
MKEKREKKKKHKKDKLKQKKSKKKAYESDSSSNSTQSDEWVEKDTGSSKNRDEWMSMTGMLKTYTKDDVKVSREDDKKHIDSYNPSTSSRELNPYWKHGGSGLPQSHESFCKSKQFMKPSDDDDYYTKPLSNQGKQMTRTKHEHRDDRNVGERKHYNWQKTEKREEKQNYKSKHDYDTKTNESLNDKRSSASLKGPTETSEKVSDSLYLSDEKMNKLAAKIVKAEIMGDTKLVNQLKVKLEAAREYRKQNPGVCKDDDSGIMLMTTTPSGNSRPLSKADSSHAGDPRSKGGKRKAETHSANQRVKYFGNDDKYNLSQMFEEEKYGTNYDQDAELAAIAAKHRNPNDDLEDIFVDEISKNRNVAKDNEKERQQAINQSMKLERSLEGCEYCIDSKNMLKHLIVSYGSKVYVALPAKKSLVKGHCIITTLQHNTCVTSLDEDIWEEILNYRKMITQFFNSQNKDVVFFETATRLHRYPHLVINCVPLPRDVGDMASIYFKKALLECEAEWSMNKKVVDLKGKNIRKGVPKGLPYFWIDFGMDPGFAHVIEDQQLFPKTFAEEIIGGMLDLNHNLWKNPQREYGNLQRQKVLEFVKEWKPFETSMKNKV